jgi:non-ribosomal peptide synthetase component F
MALLAVTPYSFDIAALELLLPLTVGARVVIADETCARDGGLLSARIERGDVTVMQATPGDMADAARRRLEGERSSHGAVLAGRRCRRCLPRKLLPRVGSLWNLYGPTETTIWSTAARVDDADVSIGRPIAKHLLPRGR